MMNQKVKKIFLINLFSLLFVLSNVFSINYLKQIEGIYAPTLDVKKFGFNPEKLFNFLTIKNNIITDYDLEPCTAPECRGRSDKEIRFVKWYITKKVKENIYEANRRDFLKISRPKYIKYEKNILIFGTWNEEDKTPLYSWDWVRVPKEHEAAFKKRLGLK